MPASFNTSNPYSFSNFGANLAGGIPVKKPIMSTPQVGVSSPGSLQGAGLFNPKPQTPTPLALDSRGIAGLQANENRFAANNQTAGTGIIGGAKPAAPTAPVAPAQPNYQTVTTPGTTVATPTTTPTQPTQPNPSNLPTTTPGNPYIAGVASLGTQGTPQVQQANQALQNLQSNYATQSANIMGRTEPLSEANGEQGILQQKYSGLLSAAQTGVQNALAGQGQQIGALESAGGLAQPQPYGISTTPYSSVTGYTSGAGAFPNYQAGTNMQFNTATGQQLGKQASDLQTAMNQTDQNFQNVNNLFTQNGINLTQFPDFNSLTNFIQSHGNNAGTQTAVKEALNALQGSIGQIINTSGAFTPTEVTDLSKQVSAANLSPSQLQTLYNTVRQTAAIRVNNILSQAKQYEQAGPASVAGNLQPISGASQPLTGNSGGTVFGGFFGNNQQ